MLGLFTYMYEESNDRNISAYELSFSVILDPVYSKTLLDNAVELFDFAYNNNKGFYHDVVTNAAVFYR